MPGEAAVTAALLPEGGGGDAAPTAPLKSCPFVLKKVMDIPPPNILEEGDDGKGSRGREGGGRREVAAHFSDPGSNGSIRSDDEDAFMSRSYNEVTGGWEVGGATSEQTTVHYDASVKKNKKFQL